jgi:hypothetical protein
MQAGSTVLQGMLGPKMSAKLPVVGERNPYHEIFSALTNSQGVTDNSIEGNPWNHNREGATISFTDGHNTFLSDARILEMPVKPSSGSSGAAENSGYDYLYDDASTVSTTIPTSAASGGSCPARGDAARTTNWTAWLTD